MGNQLQHDFSSSAVEPTELLSNMAVWDYWGVETNLVWCKYFVQKSLECRLYCRAASSNFSLRWVKFSTFSSIHTPFPMRFVCLFYCDMGISRSFVAMVKKGFRLGWGFSQNPWRKETISAPCIFLCLDQVQLDSQISM